MNTFHFKESSIKLMIEQIEEKIGGEFNRQFYQVDNDLLKGYIRYFNVLGNIEISINSFECKKDTTFILEGDQSTERNLCFRFKSKGFRTIKNIDKNNIRGSSNDIIVFDTSLGSEIILYEGKTVEWIGLRITKKVFDDGDYLLFNYFENLFSRQEAWVLYDTIPLDIYLLINDIFNLDFSQQPIVYNLMILSKVSEMTSIFFKRLLSQKTLSYTGIHKEDLKKLMIIKDAIISDLENSPSIDLLVNQYGFSASKLRNDFKAVFGTSIIQFHLNYRLEQAKILLASQNVTVQEVSRICGFNSNTKFSHYFKKKFSISPKDISLKYQHLNDRN